MIARTMKVTAAAAVLALMAGCGSNTTGSASGDNASQTSTAAAGDAKCPNGGTVRMAVEPYETSALLLPAYEPIAKQLGEKLGCKVKLLITQSYTAEIEAMRNNKLELAQFGPFGYILAHDRAKAQAVATFGGSDGQPSTYYASIVSPKGTGITTLDGVKDKSFAYSDPASTSGHLFPAFLLKKAGIDPNKGVKAIYAGSHTASYEALRNKKVDAGELNSEQIATAKSQGIYDPSKFVTLAKSDPIPVDPFAVRGDLQPAFQKKVAQALTTIDLSKLPKKARDALVATGGIVPTQDSAYDFIRQVQKSLGLGVKDLG